MNSRNNTLAYGVAYVEMADINLLTTQVQQATYLVDENQAIVTSLSGKLAQYTAYLVEATNNRTDALNILNAVKDMSNNVSSLSSNVAIAKKQTDKATIGISKVAREMSDLINKLIFSTEIIEKFGMVINKQKQINPLIPDTLIALVSKAISDANKAIALTLVALQSSYAAEATALEAQSLTRLEDEQAKLLLSKVQMDANLPNDQLKVAAQHCTLGADGPGILALMLLCYQNANHAYNEALDSVNMVTTQLAAAQSALDTANTELSSYTAGLSAATAAAYAA